MALSGTQLLVAALALDALDAALALWVTDPVVVWGRVLAGIGVAALATGVYGRRPPSQPASRRSRRSRRSPRYFCCALAGRSTSSGAGIQK